MNVGQQYQESRKFTAVLTTDPEPKGVGAVGRPPPTPALKGHFSAECTSANILNIVRL